MEECAPNNTQPHSLDDDIDFMTAPSMFIMYLTYYQTWNTNSVLYFLPTWPLYVLIFEEYILKLFINHYHLTPAPNRGPVGTHMPGRSEAQTRPSHP